MENNTSDLAGINRRKFERFTFASGLVVEAEKFQVISDVYGRNLSLHGACISSHKSMAVGSIITAEIPSSKLHLIAEVRWVRPESDHQFEIGVKFHELFPQTKQQISDLIHQLRIAPVVEIDQASQLVLEQNIGTYLDKYVEEIKPDPIDVYPTFRRKIITGSENSFSVYTTSKSKTLDLSSKSFRLDEKTEIRKTRFYVRLALGIVLVAASIAFYFFSVQDTMKVVYSELIPASVIQSEPPTDEKIENNETDFPQGTLEKLTWSNQNNHLQIVLTFRNPVQSDQFEFSRTQEYQLSQIIKVKNVEKIFEPKTIQVNSAIVPQIRLGLHQNEKQYDLQISVDLKNLDVQMVEKTQTEKTLTLDFDTVNKV